jgi:hypothetical protein
VTNARLLSGMGLFALFARIPNINKSRVRRKDSYETAFHIPF